MIRIIAAVTRDLGLGRAGNLLYHISADLRRFKSLTMGSPIVMGRHTFESFPKGPLPGRRNIVISSRADYHPEGAEVYPSLNSALQAVNHDCYIIGGGRVYKEALPLADELDLTLIDADSPDGTDTWFPPIILGEWKLDDVTEPETDERSGVEYRFARFVR